MAKGKQAATASEFVTRKVPISSLVRDPKNARKHNDRNRATINYSLATFKQTIPILVQAGTLKIIAGHGRLDEMESLGWTECEIRELPLTDDQIKQLAILDNRAAEQAEWDLENLQANLDELDAIGVSLEGLGFTQDELEALFMEEETAAEEPEPAPAKEVSSNGVISHFSILIKCRDEAHQDELLERFNLEELDCRPLNS